MTHTKDEVMAMIYNMSGEILMGKTTKKEIEVVTELAKEHDLLDLIREEFGDLHSIIVTTNPQ